MLYGCPLTGSTLGKLGNGNEKDLKKPTVISSLPTPVDQVACGPNRTMFLAKNEVWVTGVGPDGELGLGEVRQDAGGRPVIGEGNDQTARPVTVALPCRLSRASAKFSPQQRLACPRPQSQYILLAV